MSDPMEPLNQYFADMGSDAMDDTTYRTAVAMMYDCLESDVHITGDQIVNTAAYARPERRKHALAFLARETGQRLMEVSDRFVTIDQERSRFLGFRIVTEGWEMEFPTHIPKIDQADASMADSFRKSAAKHPEAGAATVSDTAPHLLNTSARSFVPKEAIWLNRMQRQEVQRLEEGTDAFSVEALQRISAHQQSVKSLLLWIIRSRRPENARMKIAQMNSVFRKIVDTRAELESLIYAEAMGKHRGIETEIKLVDRLHHLRHLFYATDHATGY